MWNHWHCRQPLLWIPLACPSCLSLCLAKSLLTAGWYWKQYSSCLLTASWYLKQYSSCLLNARADTWNSIAVACWTQAGTWNSIAVACWTQAGTWNSIAVACWPQANTWNSLAVACWAKSRLFASSDIGYMTLRHDCITCNTGQTYFLHTFTFLACPSLLQHRACMKLIGC